MQDQASSLTGRKNSLEEIKLLDVTSAENIPTR